MTGRMSILCCGRGSSTPVDKPPIQIQPPRILRRLSLISISRPQTTRQSIEAFYNEGRELFQARQEESGRSSLRAAKATSETTTRDFLRDENTNGDASESGRDLGSKTTWSQLFENNGSKMFVSGYFSNVKLGFPSTCLTREDFSLRLPFRSSSANELRPRKISVVPITNANRTMTLGKSTPILGGSLLPEAAQKIPRLIPPCPSKFPGVLVPLPPNTSSLTLTIETTGPKTSTVSGATPISMASVLAPSPCLMPTTAPPTNESPTGVPLNVDGATTETGRDLLSAVNSPKEIKPSIDTMASDECFYHNEVFSNIAAWVRPSTSTFMSFPSSPDPNRSEVPEIPFCVGNTPDLAKSVSSKYYSPPETAVTGNTGTSTPAPFHPPTPKYSFRPSVDNASSFYPSCETSRCQSLAGSIGTPAESLEMSMLYAARMLSRTPRPSDVNVNDSFGYPVSRFPWMNRGSHKSPEPVTMEDVFARSSSLARLDQSQKRGRDLQRVPRVKPRDFLKHPQLEDPLTQKCNEEFEGIHMPERHVPNGGSDWLIDGNQKYYNNDTMTTPTNTTNDSKYTSWMGFPTRVSSLQVPNGMARDARNRRPPHAWKYGNSKGNSFNYGKNDKRNSLKNSVSLGERMWERHGTRNVDQENPQNTNLPGPIPDSDLRDEDIDGNGRQINKRAMIRSRSMTLRRTFTNSIAKLRGKVSFSGSSKAAPTPPYPIDKSRNRDRFYQTRYERQGNSNVSNEKIREEVDVTELDMGSIIFGLTLPKEMLEHECERESNKDTSPGAIQHDGVELDSPFDLATANQSVLESTYEGLKSRPWSTIYDDCVAFPFAEDETGDGTESELETPTNGFFDAREKRLGLVWRDAKESIETSV